MTGLGDRVTTMTSALQLMRAIGRDERGAVLVYVSIAMTVFMGFAALVIDGGRLFTLNTEMQSAADAMALAAAAELDGIEGARERATNAMADLIANDQRFATGPAAIAVPTPIFLKALPSDDQPLSAATPATGDADARFVQVTLTERSIDTIFAPAIGGDDTAGTDAVAVAGFTQAVCKFTPLFMCNPYEGTGTDLFDALKDPDEKRRLIELRRGPSAHGAQYFPGNFGLLEAHTGPGVDKLRKSLAAVNPGVCFAQTGVQLKTGSATAIRQGVNTRFDIYEGSLGGGSDKSNPNYRPAENVIKGYTPRSGKCVEPDPNTPPVTMAMPLDDCSASPACGTLGGGGAHVWGNGVWNFEAYWDWNHGDRDGIFEESDGAPSGWSNDHAGGNLPSRYDVYRHEVEEDEIPDQTSQGGEDGNPQCYSGPAPSDEPDRRIIYAAVLNCDELDITGGSADSVPALTFLKMFITRPVAEPSEEEDGSIFVEMVDVVQPGVDDEVVHDIVQLYR